MDFFFQVFFRRIFLERLLFLNEKDSLSLFHKKLYKQNRWEQEQIADMKEYIARFGHGSAKLARQAQSKEKTLEKMVR